MSTGEPTKVTFYLTPAALAALEATSYAEALTRTDVINRALVAYAAIGAAARGEAVNLSNHDGTLWKSAVVR
jgi:hypothetical protein